MADIIIVGADNAHWCRFAPPERRINKRHKGEETMNNEDAVEPYKTIATTISATSVFFIHAFCVLAQQLDVDLQLLMDELRSLSVPDAEKGFQKIYSSLKEHVLSNLGELQKQKDERSST
ncbi:MAG: hypothetical protein H6Q54_2045 [Deltaproteobacteria bacterium]|nr:hypothetical protein [Deltaproteobacteria bacterium]